MSSRLTATARREQLLEVALDVFARAGYHATSMNEVAEAAGVTKPVLYQHFESKRELYQALLDEVGARMLTAIVTATADAPDGRSQTEIGFRAYFRWVAEDHAAFMLLYGSGSRRDEEFSRAVRRVTGRHGAGDRPADRRRHRRGAPPDAGPRPRRAGRGRQPPPRRAGRRLRPRRAGPPGRRPRLGRPPRRAAARCASRSGTRSTTSTSAADDAVPSIAAPDASLAGGRRVASVPQWTRRRRRLGIARPATFAPGGGEHRPTARALPVSHPAVRWASRHSVVGTAAPRRRPQPSDPIRRSLGRHLDQGFRPDIEGLRALAVAAVVVFHARLLGLHGGFIGVDVFFVVSGLPHHPADPRRAGRHRAPLAGRVLGPAGPPPAAGLGAGRRRHGVRRAPRAAAADAAHGRRPTSSARRRSRPTSSSPTGWAATSAPSSAQSTPSPLLHFWSLAVEEQFYLCWPPLLALLVCRPRQYRRLLLVTIGDARRPRLRPGRVRSRRGRRRGRSSSSRRAWASCWPARCSPSLGTQVRVIPPVVRAAMAWTGLAVIVVGLLAFDEAMPWPGTAVLVPVVATMAVIVGGSAARVPWRPTAGPARRRRCNGSGGTPTPCTCGTGRCSCWPTPAGDR